MTPGARSAARRPKGRVGVGEFCFADGRMHVGVVRESGNKSCQVLAQRAAREAHGVIPCHVFISFGVVCRQCVTCVSLRLCSWHSLLPDDAMQAAKPNANHIGPTKTL